MTRLMAYRCDRCGKTFHLPEAREPFKLQTSDDDYELCEDCEVSFTYFLRYPDRFDKLVERIAEEEAGE